MLSLLLVALVAVATVQACEENGGTCVGLFDTCSGNVDLSYSCSGLKFCCMPDGAVEEPGTPGPPVDLPPQGTCGNAEQSFIVGGSGSFEGAWPWQASLQYNQGSGFSHICGATLIYRDWAVTASHCVSHDSSTSNFQLVLGEHSHSGVSGSEQFMAIESITMHENYNENGNGIPNDIALIKLRQPASLTNGVALACLPTADDEFTATDECWITGWGKTEGDSNTLPDVLQEVRIDVRTNAECTQSWQGIFGASILSSHICVGDGYPTACNGDSGGPLVCKRSSDQGYVLAGVTSWGYRGCSTKPAVYTRVSSFLNWIGNKV